MSICYLNGEFVQLKNAMIPATNLGLHRGLGIFDLFRSRDAKPSFLEDYLARFENSQKFLNLGRVIPKDDIRSIVGELQSRNAFSESIFKMVLIAEGEESDELFEPFFFIINKELPTDLKPKPSKLITHEYHREYPDVKSLNYMASFKLQQKRVSQGAIDVLYHKDGLVSETSRSNVFVVKDGVIKTADDVLQGITRKHLIEGIDHETAVIVGPVTTDELFSADEVFITSTIKEVMPIVQIDDHVIGNGQTGVVTKQLQDTFLEIVMSL